MTENTCYWLTVTDQVQVARCSDVTFWDLHDVSSRSRSCSTRHLFFLLLGRIKRFVYFCWDRLFGVVPGISDCRGMKFLFSYFYVRVCICVCPPCAIKSRSSLVAPAHTGGPGKRAVKWLWCVVVCMCLCVCMSVCIARLMSACSCLCLFISLWVLVGSCQTGRYENSRRQHR